MKAQEAARTRFVLPLPRFVLQPFTAAVVAGVHLYLAAGHLAELTAGHVEWTHLWKGFGALGGAYVFAALASRGLAGRSVTPPILLVDTHGERPSRAGSEARPLPYEASP